MQTLQIAPFFTHRIIDSFVLLIFNVIIAVFVNYVILTQSKSLGTFKYYIINQVLWAQLLEIMFTVLCPVFLPPYVGAFQTGILRTVATPMTTGILSVITVCIFINTTFGVFFSLLNRLIFTFHPNLKRNIHNKYTFTIVIMLHLIIYVIIAFFTLAAIDNAKNIRITISNETNGELLPFFNESSLLYVSDFGGLTQTACFGVFLFIMLGTGVLIGGAGLFIYNVVATRSTSKTVSQHSFSLIVSSLVQTSLCITNLMLPASGLLFFWAFRIQNSVNITCSLLILVNLHSLLDMICILVFVKPYRTYCLRFFRIGNKTMSQNVLVLPCRSTSEKLSKK